MPLPTTRNTTYAADTPIRSADLNALQDAVIGEFHGDVVEHRSLGMPAPTGWQLGINNSNPTLLATTGGPNDIRIDLQLPVGATLKSVTVAASGNGADDLDLDIERYHKGATAGTSIQHLDVDDVPAGFADYTITPGAGAKVDANTYLALRLQCPSPAASLMVKNLRFTWFKDALT